MSAARRKVVEQLLVEASGNDPRKVSEGSLRLHADGLIDWSEKTRRGLVARTGLVHHRTLWDLVDQVVSSPGPASGGDPS